MQQGIYAGMLRPEVCLCVCRLRAWVYVCMFRAQVCVCVSKAVSSLGHNRRSRSSLTCVGLLVCWSGVMRREREKEREREREREREQERDSLDLCLFRCSIMCQVSVAAAVGATSFWCNIYYVAAVCVFRCSSA